MCYCYTDVYCNFLCSNYFGNYPLFLGIYVEDIDISTHDRLTMPRSGSQSDALNNSFNCVNHKQTGE